MKKLIYKPSIGTKGMGKAAVGTQHKPGAGNHPKGSLEHTKQNVLQDSSSPFSDKSSPSKVEARHVGFESFRVVLVVAVVLTISLLIFKAKITGLAFLSQGSPNLTFVAPTPENGSILNLPFIIVNISQEGNLSFLVLSWGGQNMSMEESPAGAFARVNGSGRFSFVAYALSENSSIISSESRTITLSYVNWSSIPGQLIQEDTRFDMDVWDNLVAVREKSQLGLSVGQDRTDRVFCSLDHARFLNCTTMQDAVGQTAITLTADDGVLSPSQSFNISILPINDPPRFVGSIAGKNLRPLEWWDIDLGGLVIDPESDIFTLGLSGAIPIPVQWVASRTIRFLPNMSSIGSYNVSIVANDSQNSSVSNVFVIQVRENLAPQVITKLTALVLNNTRAYSLKFYQIFEDPDDDDLTFSFDNISFASIIRKKNTLFIVPHENKTGSQNLKMTASDGQVTTAFSLPVILISPEEVLAAPGASISSSVDEKIGDVSLSKGPKSTPVPESVKVDMLNEVVQNTSASGQWSKIDVSNLDVPPISESSLQPSSMNKTRGPILLKPFPVLFFDENTTNITLNLNEYFPDPAGKGLEFLIEPKSPFVTKIQSKSIAVISLSAPGERPENKTVKILAKDINGNIVTGKVLVSVSSAVARHQDLIDTLLIASIIMALAIIAGILSVRFVPSLIHREDQIQDLGSRRVSQTGLRFAGAVPSRPSLAGNVVSGGVAGFGKDVLFDTWDSVASVFNRMGRLDEPPELRSAAMLLREAHAILKVILSSTDDELVQSALEREEEKISRALSLMRRKAQLSQDELKRVLLYIKEASVCLGKILEIADEPLIIGELKKEAFRLDNIAKLIEVKMAYLMDENV